MNYLFQIKKVTVLLAAIMLASACHKMVEVEPPAHLITEERVFNDEAATQAALLGIYSRAETVDNQLIPFLGLYCDEFVNPVTTSNTPEFAASSLSPLNSTILNQWRTFYSIIYQANNLIKGMEQLSRLDLSFRQQVQAEALYLRAWCYFYLVNIWGDVPLVTGTDVAINAGLARTPKTEVMKQIREDLNLALNWIAADYPSTEKVRVHQLAVRSFLARVYLYSQDWQNAADNASQVLESGAFRLLDDPSGSFIKNNEEAILQLWNASGRSLGRNFVPSNSRVKPTYSLAAGLLEKFDTLDKRFQNWLGTNTVQGVRYYYPFKYKQRLVAEGAEGEYLVVARLAELLLIRAEAYAVLMRPEEAISDLNKIRERAGLAPLQGVVTIEEVKKEIDVQRQLELFGEGGHRFFDLKRRGELDQVLGPLKPQWQSYKSEFPIPQQEISVNQHLTQNHGY